VVISVFRRGRLQDIVNKEYPGVRTIPLGRHRQRRLGKLFGLFDREARLLALISRERFDIVTGYGFYPAIASRPLGIRSVLFHDEYEHEISLLLARMFGTRLVVPDSLPITGRNVRRHPGFKELAYLLDFVPDPGVLKEYGVKVDGYVFVRDIAPITASRLRYVMVDLEPVLRKLRRKGLRILYYGESDEKKDTYRKYCTILKEPLTDIFSLLYYAKCVITSGDSIAREAALLGTPMVYTGHRTMKANRPLYEMGAHNHPLLPGDIDKAVRAALKPGRKREMRAKIKYNIGHEWADTTEIVLEELLAGER
jgi:predicted glycosyltransferase